MSEASFDPFDLPATFDPLAPVAPAPPRRRRLAAAATAAAEAAPGLGANAGGGAGGRLIHLLRPGPREATSAVDANARIAALEVQVATLIARLDALET